MPVLSNHKWERFAQELAKGKTADEAYTIAGYKANRGNAATLKANQSILNRVVEIQERGAIRAEITRADILTRLNRAAERAAALDGPAAIQAERATLMDIAKLEGWVIDKQEQGRPGDFDKMTNEQLAEFIARGTYPEGKG